jgi:hypothetical protein
MLNFCTGPVTQDRLMTGGEMSILKQLPVHENKKQRGEKENKEY